MFAEERAIPDFLSMEREVQQLWLEQDILRKYLNKNSDCPTFSFIDGPITANNPMGVHHAWGRTYKDIFLRYATMQGYAARYQNGFDCHGLWVEVEVEKELGFKDKGQIVEYGLDKFIAKCKERVQKYSEIQTKQSLRLGQWMEWDKSYYTYTDNNIEHIWHFLKICQQSGWLYESNRVLPWCPRCGTSLSQHEMLGSYKELTHLALYVAFPLKQQENTFLLAWTTTPWTLPANVALAVNPGLQYVKIEVDGKYYCLGKKAAERLGLAASIVDECDPNALLGEEYGSLFPELFAQQGVSHRVIPWSDIDALEGTGIVHIAPGCGAEDHSLAGEHKLQVLAPLTENATYIDGYGVLSGKTTTFANEWVPEQLQQRGFLFRNERYTHRYPTCWRCGEELVFRLVKEWFIGSDELRSKLKKAAAEVEWIPAHAGKRMQDWLDNMGDWCISRKRFWGLPLPFYPCECGHVTVVSSRDEMRTLAVEPKLVDEMTELHRPHIDNIKIRCSKCGMPVKRVLEVGDCWLDAGIVPFSTLGYLGGKEYWRQWFPANLVVEMREQIRLWFYSLLFMSVVLEGRPPYRQAIVYEKVHDKDGREMHKSWGNAIWFDDAVENMGADVMRWIYAGHKLDRNLNFGFHLAEETRRKLLTLWNVYVFFTTYARIDKWKPSYAHLQKPDLDSDPDSIFDKWLLARTDSLVRGVTDNLNKRDVGAVLRKFEGYFSDVSNWYVRCNRRRFWKGKWDESKKSAYSTLYYALVRVIKLMAPITPHLSEHMYQNLVARQLPQAPESVHLCSYPARSKQELDTRILVDMELVREVVNLGHSARNEAQIRVRQPLQSIIVCDCSSDSTAIEELSWIIRQELNVKQVRFARGLTTFLTYAVKPNLRVLGPRFGRLTAQVAEALRRKVFQEPPVHIMLDLEGEKVQLNQQEFLLEEQPKPGLRVVRNDNLAVVLDTNLTPDLVEEGWVRDLVRNLQILRKEQGFAINDRICFQYHGSETVHRRIKRYGEHISREILAVNLEKDPDLVGNSTQFSIDGESIWLAISRDC